MTRTVLVALTALLACAARASAQQARVVLTADTIRVGDVVGVVIQLTVPGGAELIVPDTLDLYGDLENAARKRVRVDSLAGGALQHLITYPITAWRSGQHPLPSLNLHMRRAGYEQAFTVDLPDINVASVLPADTAGLEARPPRDVWGASRVWWPILVAGLLALAVLAALIWWWRRRQPRALPSEPTLPVIPPREWALRELERIAAAGWIERAEYRRFYIELSETMRRYAALLDGNWGADLTTRELTARMRQASSDPGELQALLERADLVKFAQHDPGHERPRADCALARAWVEAFEKPVPFAEAA
jgi:hypothetical protein